jgi:hypothetical protein
VLRLARCTTQSAPEISIWVGTVIACGVGDHALGGLVQAQQDVHRDGPRDQRVGS